MVTAFWIFLKSPMTTWLKPSWSDDPEPFSVADFSLAELEEPEELVELLAAVAVPVITTDIARAANTDPHARTNERRMESIPSDLVSDARIVKTPRSDAVAAPWREGEQQANIENPSNPEGRRPQM